MAWRAIPIRTFTCPACLALHDEACPPVDCRTIRDDLIPAADVGLPPEFIDQHGTGLISMADAEAWMARDERARQHEEAA